MVELDALDFQILNVLMKDGQTSNVDMSRAFGTSVNTIRNRIQRMIDNKVLQVIGVTNPVLLGFDVHVIIGVDVDYPFITSVAEGFAQMKPVRYVAYAAGEHDLVVMAFFKDSEHFFHWLTEQVSQLKGITGMKTMIIGQELKRNYDYVGQVEEMQKLASLKEEKDDN